MLAYIIVAVIFVSIVFIVWSALHITSQTDKRLALFNKDDLNKRSEKLREQESGD